MKSTLLRVMALSCVLSLSSLSAHLLASCLDEYGHSSCDEGQVCCEECGCCITPGEEVE